MEEFVKARLEKAEELRKEIDSLKRQQSIWSALIELQKDTRWQVVEKKLKEEVDAKLVQLLKMDDKGYLPRVDRKRATLRAEINALRRFVLSPSIAERDFEASNEEIKRLESEASAIEDKFGHVRQRKF